MKKPLVAILGSGPAGLLAAHACELYKVPYVIFSNKEKSVLGGAQYSHIPIPGIHDEEADVTLKYWVVGKSETYRNKVYGEGSRVPFVSFDNVHDGKMVPAWSLPQMYDFLWDWYSHRITDVQLDPNVAQTLDHSAFFDIVFSSVPITALCLGGSHWFRSSTVRILNEALDASFPDNTIRYDGTEEHSYYRMSKIFGVGSTEWGSHGALPPIQGLRTVNKPVETTCDCHPNIIRIGRYGTWEKGVLTFHAWNKVIDTFAERGLV